MRSLYLIAISICGFIVAGCAKDDVPAVSDPHNIVVEGQKMKQMEFLNKYCQGKVDNETCLKVNQAMRQDATKGDGKSLRF